MKPSEPIAKAMFGMTVSEAKEKAVCVICKGDASSFRDELSRKEYTISGLCQKCQDKTFGS